MLRTSRVWPPRPRSTTATRSGSIVKGDPAATARAETTTTSSGSRQVISSVRSADCYGVLHATAEGSCSWYEFAHEIFRIAGVGVNLQPAAPDEFPAKVPRPTYSVLASTRLTQARLNTFTDWKQALQTYLVPHPATV